MLGNRWFVLLILIVLLNPVTGDKKLVTTVMPGHACLESGNRLSNTKCLNDTRYCKQHCVSHEKNCHAVYKSMGNSGELQPFFMACWKEQTQGECHNNTCILKYDPEFDNYSCCCSGYLCNQNIVFPPSTTVSGTSIAPTPKSTIRRYTLFYVSASVLILLILAGVAIYLFLKRKRRTSEHNRLLMAISTAPSTHIPTRSAQLLEVLHHGKMSRVLKGIYLQRQVAIKIIQRQNRNLWVTERDMFERYKLRNENLLNFIVAEKRQQNGDIQYWLVTEYHEFGSLEKYLEAFVLPVELLLKMLYSIVKGLTYLHSGDICGDRPMVAHRDIKSGNILVKKDLSCCIGDLGLAVALSQNNEMSYDLCQAGTKRYMAPEILQGTITYQQDSFLHVDVYALGLVTWELFSRTKIGDVEPDVYRPPYFDSVGCHPNIDEMLKCVVETNTRPFVNPRWRKTQTLDTMCGTMEKCWEDDGGARLTVQCVYERIKQLIYDPPDNTYEPQVLEKLKSIEECSSNSSGSNNSCSSIGNCDFADMVVTAIGDIV